jgi:hypothetical protein
MPARGKLKRDLMIPDSLAAGGRGLQSGLRPRCRPNVLGIYQHLLNVPFQHCPHRPPVDSGFACSTRALVLRRMLNIG